VVHDQSLPGGAKGVKLIRLAPAAGRAIRAFDLDHSLIPV
jgi:hypothetical protein